MTGKAGMMVLPFPVLEVRLYDRHHSVVSAEDGSWSLARIIPIPEAVFALIPILLGSL